MTPAAQASRPILSDAQSRALDELTAEQERLGGPIPKGATIWKRYQPPTRAALWAEKVLEKVDGGELVAVCPEKLRKRQQPTGDVYVDDRGRPSTREKGLEPALMRELLKSRNGKPPEDYRSPQGSTLAACVTMPDPTA